MTVGEQHAGSLHDVGHISGSKLPSVGPTPQAKLEEGNRTINNEKELPIHSKRKQMLRIRGNLQGLDLCTRSDENKTEGTKGVR